MRKLPQTGMPVALLGDRNCGTALSRCCMAAAAALSYGILLCCLTCRTSASQRHQHDCQRRDTAPNGRGAWRSHRCTCDPGPADAPQGCGRQYCTVRTLRPGSGLLPPCQLRLQAQRSNFRVPSNCEQMHCDRKDGRCRPAQLLGVKLQRTASCGASSPLHPLNAESEGVDYASIRHNCSFPVMWL